MTGGGGTGGKRGHRRQRSLRQLQQQQQQHEQNSSSPSSTTSSAGTAARGSDEHNGGGGGGYRSDDAGKVYYAPTGGVNCTAASTSSHAHSTKGSGGSGSKADGSGGGGGGGQSRPEGASGGGAFKPMCGVDVVVSPGGDDKYRFYWEWLPAFSGVPGRINELGGGEGAFVDSVFIGGEFTPPVLVWRNDPHIGPSTTGERGRGRDWKGEERVGARLVQLV